MKGPFSLGGLRVNGRVCSRAVTNHSLIECCGVGGWRCAAIQRISTGLVQGSVRSGRVQGGIDSCGFSRWRLEPVIPPRSVRESGEQRVQIEPRVDAQVRRQVACSAPPARQPARSQLESHSTFCFADTMKVVEEKMPSGRRNGFTRTMMSRNMPCNVSACFLNTIDHRARKGRKSKLDFPGVPERQKPQTRALL